MRNSGTRLHRIWGGMKDRCNNPKSKDVSRYGGRGIKICKEWDSSFLAFKEWAENNGYKEYLTIDRIDVNGNYEPSNCRWADLITQGRNRRNNKMVTAFGKTQCMASWAEEFNIPHQTLRERILSLNIPPEEALMCKSDRRKKEIQLNGRTQSIVDWAKEYGIKSGVLEKRLKQGMSLKEALSKPVQARRKSCRQGRYRIIEFGGERHSLTEWSKITGIHISTLSYRLSKLMMTPEEALTTPIMDNQSRRKKII